MKTHDSHVIEDTRQANILVVDHQPASLKKIRGLLTEAGYKDVQTTDDPFSVVSYCQEEEIDLIILEIKMPRLDGFSVMNSLREDVDEQDIPTILVLTDVDDQGFRREALHYGARDYIVKPFDTEEFLARVHNLLELWQANKIVKYQNEILEQKVQERTRELQTTQKELLKSRFDVVWRLGRAAEYRDNETGMHIMRMSHIAAILGRACGLDEAVTELLLVASPMHDIGKLGIPDNILLKGNKLNAREWEIMKTHAQIGADILAEGDSELMKMAHDIALTHHEKWDGTGYPHGLRGEDIPLVGRICALADVFDALTSERPYKKAWSLVHTLKYIKEQSGKQFDPGLVELLEQELPKVLLIKKKYADKEDRHPLDSKVRILAT